MKYDRQCQFIFLRIILLHKGKTIELLRRGVCFFLKKKRRKLCCKILSLDLQDAKNKQSNNEIFKKKQYFSYFVVVRFYRWCL